MSRIRLLFLLNKNKKNNNIMMMIIIVLMGMIISCSVFANQNNQIVFQEQLNQLNIEKEQYDLIKDNYSLAMNVMENVLSLFSIISILIGVLGISSLLTLKSMNMKRARTILRLYGMSFYALSLKSIAESIILGFIGGMVGTQFGYRLFNKITMRIFNLKDMPRIGINDYLFICLRVMFFLMIIIVIIDIDLDAVFYEESLICILNKRESKINYKKNIFIIVCELLFFVWFLNMTLIINNEILNCVLLVGIAFLIISIIIFDFIYKKLFIKLRSINNRLNISVCFLNTRCFRASLLSVILASGIVMVCIILNIILNIDGILQDAYRNNMGYAVLIRTYSDEDANKIEKILNNYNSNYIRAKSGLVGYNQLNWNKKKDNGKFYALLVENNNSTNKFFEVQKGEFKSENLFETKCKLCKGEEYNFFKSEIKYAGNLKFNQNLAMVNVSVLMNKEDWKLDNVNKWDTVFLLDVSNLKLKTIQLKLNSKKCEIETASMLVDELKNVLSEYIEVVEIIGIMHVMIIVIVIVVMIYTDIFNRRKELLLYQIFGASKKNAINVIFIEYLIISSVAALCVTIEVAIIGELYFVVFLNCHYMISIPIIIITLAFAVGLTNLCCLVMGRIADRKIEKGMIRDD